MEHVADGFNDVIPVPVDVDAGPINRAEVVGQLPPQDGSSGVGGILAALCQPISVKAIGLPVCVAISE
jgi:hypothetical protein